MIAFVSQKIFPMLRSLLLSLSLIAATAASAQTTVFDPNAQPRTVNSFTAISVAGGVDLYVSEGKEEALVVSARTAEFRDAIKTEVRNGTLYIKFEWRDGRNWTLGSNKQLKAYVSYKALKGLSASGGSDVIVDGTLRSESLSLEVSGGSDFLGRLDVGNLNIDASGGSDVDISGRAAKMSIDASGGSDVAGFELTAEECTVDASGGSDVSVTVTGNLRADASGGSDVTYKGGTDRVQINKSGGGSVRKG